MSPMPTLPTRTSIYTDYLERQRVYLRARAIYALRDGRPANRVEDGTGWFYWCCG